MRGGQRQVLTLITALKEAGHESVLLSRRGSPLAQAASAAGFSVFPAGIREVWRQSRPVALVHAHDGRAHTLAAIASKRPFVVSRRVAFPVRRSPVSAWKYQKAARFLAVSHHVARELEAGGTPKEKIDVVYDGVEAVTPAEEWNRAYPAVALASRDPAKGRDLVEQAAQIAGIPVLFSDDLAKDLRRASMFVYITRSEGLGSAALRAMSMGVPVVASHIGGLTEVFTDNVSGIFVANEPATIASAMRRILDEPSLPQYLIKHGKARIEECFTREHLLAGTLASYGRALGRG